LHRNLLSVLLNCSVSFYDYTGTTVDGQIRIDRWGKDTDSEKPTSRRKTCPNATLATIKYHVGCLEIEPGPLRRLTVCAITSITARKRPSFLYRFRVTMEHQIS